MYVNIMEKTAAVLCFAATPRRRLNRESSAVLRKWRIVLLLIATASATASTAAAAIAAASPSLPNGTKLTIATLLLLLLLLYSCVFGYAVY
jgi:hypothetical protein